MKSSTPHDHLLSSLLFLLLFFSSSFFLFRLSSSSSSLSLSLSLFPFPSFPFLSFLFLSFPFFFFLRFSRFSNYLAGGSVVGFVVAVVSNFALILGTLAAIGIVFLLSMWFLSLYGSGGPANWEKYIIVKDQKLAQEYKGIKIPMETMFEAYMAEKIDF